MYLPAQCRFCLFSLGQHDRKGRAFAGGAFYLHLCAGQFQNPLDQRHAKAIALGGVARVALVEFIVDVFYRLFIHAAAGIGHGNIKFAVRPRLRRVMLPPCGVNFTALESKFVHTSSSKPGSACV